MRQSVVDTQYKDYSGMTHLGAVGTSQLVLWEKGKDPIELERQSYVYSVAFSPDSTYLVSGHNNRAVKVWNVQTNQLDCQFKHSDSVRAVAFSPDGNFIAAGANGKNNNLKVWSLATQKEVKSLTGHSSDIRGLSYSSCGKFLVSGGHDQKIRVWNTDSMTERQSFDEPTWTSGNYCPVRFIPHTNSFVSGGRDGSIKIWSVDSPNHQAPFTGHNSNVLSIDVSSCGRYIVAGDYSKNQVVLYDMNGYLYTYEGHSSSWNCAAFSPCGKFIVSGGRDNLMLTWVNWKKLSDDGLLQNGGDWAAKQYVRVNHDGASIAGKTASSLKG